jgi:hypothetical protein
MVISTARFQGFLNPTKTDRRFFQSRLRELIENRVVERVMVPSAIRSGPASVPCIRLISNDDDAANQPGETHITEEPPTYVAPGSYARAKCYLPD